MRKLWLSDLSAFSGKTDIGLVPRKNTVEKNSHATSTFIVIPAKRTNALLPSFAVIKLSFALKSAWSLGSSPLSLTNPQSGKRLSV